MTPDIGGNARSIRTLARQRARCSLPTYCDGHRSVTPRHWLLRKNKRNFLEGQQGLSHSENDIMHRVELQAMRDRAVPSEETARSEAADREARLGGSVLRLRRCVPGARRSAAGGFPAAGGVGEATGLSGKWCRHRGPSRELRQVHQRPGSVCLFGNSCLSTEVMQMARWCRDT